MNLRGAQTGVYPWGVFTPAVKAAYSGREFPRSRTDVFLQQAGFLAGACVRVRQVHGNRVLSVKASELPSLEVEADGLFTAERGLVLGILTADCLPLFFEGGAGSVVGVVHAGWRGLKAGIIEEALGVLRRDFGILPDRLRTAVGPGIRACCYEVGSEFQAYFQKTYRSAGRENAAKGTIDLAEEARQIFIREGVQPAMIFDSGVCTSCRSDLFFSYRAERTTSERILSAIARV